MFFCFVFFFNYCFSTKIIIIMITFFFFLSPLLTVLFFKPVNLRHQQLELSISAKATVLDDVVAYGAFGCCSEPQPLYHYNG